MTNETELSTPKVSVTFTRSSTKDGGQGYTIRVDEGATEDECTRVFDLANVLRIAAVKQITGDKTDAD